MIQHTAHLLFTTIEPTQIRTVALPHQRWLLYGIGTIFSMAVLSAMVSIAMEMVVRVSAAFWGTAALGRLVGQDFTDGMTSQAMQRGGMGLILTILILSVPPMAAAFFQGALGNFMHFSA